MVGAGGFEPPATCASGKYSSPELCAQLKVFIAFYLKNVNLVYIFGKSSKAFLISSSENSTSCKLPDK